MSKPILVLNYQYTKDVEARIARDYTVRRVARESPGHLEGMREGMREGLREGVREEPREKQREEVLRALEGADALFFNPPLRLDGEFFRRVPGSVKVIATFSVGYDHIDLRAAAERGIPIANTPGVLTDATADLTMLLLLGASRRAYESQQILRTGAWAKRTEGPLLGWQPTGKVLGIYGMGRIGQAVARRARAFGMKIHYCNRKRLSEGVLAEELAWGRGVSRGCAGFAAGERVFEFAGAAHSGDASFSECGGDCAAAGGSDCGERGAGRAGGG